MRRSRFGLLLLLMGAITFAPLHGVAYAGVISTEQYLGAVDRQHALERIDTVLARAEVKQRLEQLGVEPAQAVARAAALSDAELIELAENLENLPAGGDLIGVIGIVFIVLLVLELVGVTDVFSKI